MQSGGAEHAVVRHGPKEVEEVTTAAPVGDDEAVVIGLTALAALLMVAILAAAAWDNRDNWWHRK
jgi:hypothetical protein